MVAALHGVRLNCGQRSRYFFTLFALSVVFDWTSVAVLDCSQPSIFSCFFDQWARGENDEKPARQRKTEEARGWGVGSEKIEGL